jgi:hypothetical protein
MSQKSQKRKDLRTQARCVLETALGPVGALLNGAAVRFLRYPGGKQRILDYILKHLPARNRSRGEGDKRIGTDRALKILLGRLGRWDPATGAEVFEAKAHTQPVRRLFVTPDGEQLVGGARHLLTGQSSDIMPFSPPSNARRHVEASVLPPLHTLDLTSFPVLEGVGALVIVGGGGTPPPGP